MEQLTAIDLLQRLEERAVSSLELVRNSLMQIERTNPRLNAFIAVHAELASEQARASDQKRAKGESLGPLEGLPIAVKDILCTQGIKTTCGSRMLAEFVPPYDATVIARLKMAGAILIGKTNMDEFAMGASTETSAWGVTHNPWNVERTPGGSSGGAAVCVAADQVPLSLGTDTGGSIRQPAAFCGVSGLKPTYGRVSRFGLIAFASSLDQVGPLARDVSSLAILLQAIAGHDPRDSTSLDARVPDYRAATRTNIRSWKIGVVHQDQLEQVDPSIRDAVHSAANEFRREGCQIQEVRLPHAKYWVPCYYVIAPCEASSNLSRYDGAHYGFREEVSGKDSPHGPLVGTYCRSRGRGFAAEVKRRIMLGTHALSSGYRDAYYLKALRVRRLIREDYDAAFQQVDVLLGPTTPTTAYRIGERIDDPVQMYLGDLFTVGANLAGVPALSVPAGFGSDGLPVGIQFHAPPLQEEKLLAMGAAWQRATDWHQRRPSL